VDQVEAESLPEWNLRRTWKEVETEAVPAQLNFLKTQPSELRRVVVACRRARDRCLTHRAHLEAAAIGVHASMICRNQTAAICGAGW
jgi:hypothetical protein